MSDDSTDPPSTSLPSGDNPVTSSGDIGRVAELLRNVRSRHRRGRHDEAHEVSAEEESRRRGIKKRLLADPRVCPARPRLVETQHDFEAVLADLRTPEGDQVPRFAFDTEFIGESSYYPKLCLIQVATPRLIALIDPLAGLDLSGFWDVMVDASVEKLVHAGEQDLEPVARITGQVPANVLDTQVAAAFCGLPYPASLSKLVEYVSTVAFEGVPADGGLKLGKGLTFTQWDARPLSPKQLSYAADDVRYLHFVYDWITSRLGADEDRLRWLRSECEARCGEALEAADDEPWARLKGYGGLAGHGRPIVRELAVWRDAAAREMDLPPRALIKDEVLVAIARETPRTPAQLAAFRHMPRPIAERYAQVILDAVSRGLAMAQETVDYDAFEPTLADRFKADAAWATLQSLTYAQDIDPNLVTCRRDVEHLVRRLDAGKPVHELPLLTGWRGEAAGDLLLKTLTS